jgi:O-antigen/teichoic acid export membrane protein
MGYTRSALLGFSWIGLMRFLSRGGGMLRAAILARLLSPQDFGVFGIAFLVLAFLELLTETGINVVLIQEHEDAIEEYLDTAWVVSIVRGIIVSLLLCVSSPLIVLFFNEPRALPLLLLVSLVPLVRGFINPAVARFQKKLEYRRDFSYRTTLIVVETITSVGLAYITRHPISLVLGLLASAIVELIITQTTIRPRPKFRLTPHQFKQIIHSGKWVTTAGIFEYFASRSQDIVIGRAISSVSLGLYQMAVRFTTLPTSEIIEVVNRVTFPIYTKITHDKKRLRRAFFRNYLGILLLFLPLTVGIYAFADEITLLILGDAWSEVSPLMRSLSLLNAAIVLTAPSNPLLLALKKQKHLSNLTLLRAATLVIIIMPMISRWGIIGVIYATFISYVITMPVRFWYTLLILKDQHDQEKK